MFCLVYIRNENANSLRGVYAHQALFMHVTQPTLFFRPFALSFRWRLVCQTGCLFLADWWLSIYRTAITQRGIILEQKRCNRTLLCAMPPASCSLLHPNIGRRQLYKSVLFPTNRRRGREEREGLTMHHPSHIASRQGSHMDGRLYPPP